MEPDGPQPVSPKRLEVIDTSADAELDNIVALTARLFGIPITQASLVAEDARSFKAQGGAEFTETSREAALYRQTIHQSGVLLVEDATVDPRFQNSGDVLGDSPSRFYVGAPLVWAAGAVSGCLCVYDTAPHTASVYQQAMLVALAEQVVRRVEGYAAGDAEDLPPAPDVVLSGEPAETAHLWRLVGEGSTGYIEMTDDGVIVRVNASTSRMLGYAHGELLGFSALQLAHPEDHHTIAAGLQDARSGAPSSYEVTRVLRHKTGRPVPVSCTVSILPGNSERPASIAGLLVDLSPRINALGRRLTAEHDRERVLAAATDAYIALDQSGVVQEWNAAAERIFGYPADQAVGQLLASLIVPHDQREAHAAGLERVRSGGASVLVGHSTEMLGLHRDGHLLQIELTPWRVRGDDGRDNFYAFCRDVGERVTARTALLEANDRLRQGQEQMQAAFEASTSADGVMDGGGVLLDVNPQMCRFLDRTREQLLHRDLTDFVFAPDVAEVTFALGQVANAASERSELRFTAGDGQVAWGLASFTPMQTGTDGSRTAVRIESLQAFKELETTLARQSTHDAVTGLPTRGLFLERVRQALVPSESDAPVAVLVLRADGLRELNVHGGFMAGDQALEAVARRLAAVTTDDVTLAHLQPGLFAAVVPSGSADAPRLAGHYLDAFSAPAAGSAVTAVALRASIGISTAMSVAGEEDACAARLLHEAETAARLASGDGGNTIVFAAPEMREAQQRQQQLEGIVRQALDHDQVRVAYQPVFDLTTGRIVGAEALLRLIDAEGRPVSALDVVSAAEASGQIVPLGRAILQISAAQARTWQLDHGFLVPVAVNVSAVQLRRRTFTADVLEALDLAGVPPAALTLELTESVLLTSGSTGMDQLLVLRDAGVHLAIDDFGTGYASLTYLRDLPASTLKIDRSFVEGIPDDQGAMAIVRGVIDLASSFGMACIAEGIETHTQREYLAARGILGQGYLLSRPTDAASMSRLVAEHGAHLGQSWAPLSLADARDQAAERRDTAGQERDRAGTERDLVGDARDLVGDQRDLLADRRDQAGDRRDSAADNRDDLAEERDLAGALRDQAAGERDLDDAHSDAASHPVPEARGHALHLLRSSAQSDREMALQDREAGAHERALAERDRTKARSDRGAGARERLHSEQDRTTSSDDRHGGAGERTHSQRDRTTSQTDRGAAAVDRGEAFIDPLSGAHMRGAGLAELDHEISRALRTHGSLVVAFVDIDGLKAVNDSTGHATGDNVIRNVGQSLKASLRSYDLVVRYGGDEFLCAMSGACIDDIETRLAAATSAVAGQTGAASFSAGLAELRPGDTVQDLIARADADLYDRRRRGA